MRQAHPEAPVDVLAGRVDLDEYPSSLTASYNIASPKKGGGCRGGRQEEAPDAALGLIVADGFYEWRKTDSGKQPYHVKMEDGSPFAFAGLWEV